MKFCICSERSDPHNMKMAKLAFAALVLLLCTFLAACGATPDSGPDADTLRGAWAYIHDPATPIITLRDNGSARYKKQTFDYRSDGQYIILTDRDGSETSLRYELDDDGMLLYETTAYEFDGDNSPANLIGKWVNEENNWSFEFTEQGTFMEDTYFPGYYTVDTENATIKLIYNDHFEDTTLHYSVSGSTLLIEYPWSMVRAE